eukprot:gene20950-25137_t
MKTKETTMLVSNADSEEDDSDDEFEAELAASGLMDQEEREAIYNVDGLHEGLEQIGWDESVIWEEGRIITNETPTQVSDINDDLSRELAFYNQAEVLKERKKSKKDMEEKLTKWRKERNKTGGTGDEDDFPMEMMQDKPQAVKGDRSRSGGNKASKKREAKNSKFGFGGRKKDLCMVRSEQAVSSVKVFFTFPLTTLDVNW